MEAQPLRIRQNWWIAMDFFFSVRSCQGLKTYWWPNLDMLCSNGIGGLEHLCFLLFMIALLPHSACTCLLPEIIAADRMASHLALEVFAFFWGLSTSCQRCHKKKRKLGHLALICREDRLQKVALRYYVSHYGPTCLYVYTVNEFWWSPIMTKGSYQGKGHQRSFDLSAIGLTVLHLPQRTSKPASSQLRQLFLPHACGSCTKFSFWSRLCMLSCGSVCWVVWKIVQHGILVSSWKHILNQSRQLRPMIWHFSSQKKLRSNHQRYQCFEIDVQVHMPFWSTTFPKQTLNPFCPHQSVSPVAYTIQLTTNTWAAATPNTPTLAALDAPATLHWWHC